MRLTQGFKKRNKIRDVKEGRKVRQGLLSVLELNLNFLLRNESIAMKESVFRFSMLFRLLVVLQLNRFLGS